MIEIVTRDNPQYWDECVKKISAYDPFYLSSYLCAFHQQGSGEPILAVYSDEDDFAVNAFFRRDISEACWFKDRIEHGKYYDMITPYGYGGFFGQVGDKKRLLREWNQYCVENGYISEFIRFSLFSDYKDYYDGIVERHTHNVVRNLEMSIEEIWMDFKQKVRKNVKKANSFGLQIITEDNDEHLDDFMRIYYGTMERSDAEEEFFFSKEFFRRIMQLKDSFMFFYVLYEEKIISTELVIYGTENVYSYLGGTDKEYFYVRPNDFLKYEIVKWAKERGLKNFVLGGGYGADDGIFQYKTSLAPHGITDFYIGKKVMDVHTYKELCRMRNIDINDATMTSGFFPKYRV